MSILIVDDSNESRCFIEFALKQGGYSDLKTANSAEDAFDYLANEYDSISDPLDLILFDIIDGNEALKHIKAQETLKDIPVIVVTANNNENVLKKAFELGAADFITKPYSKTELLARVRSILNLKYEMDYHIQLTRQLEEANRKLQKLTLLDGLTGISNRRHFDMTIESEWKRAQRESKPISFILVDIDFFKNYNDHYGHQDGDDCIRDVANAVISITKRPADLVARYGGEEFAIILPDTGTNPAMQLAKAARKAVESLQIKHDNSHISDYVTISLGVATVTPRATITYENLIKAADSALYQAKVEGRNRVMVTDSFKLYHNK